MKNKTLSILFYIFILTNHFSSAFGQEIKKIDVNEQKSAEERFLALKKKFGDKDTKKKEEDNSWFFIYYSLGKSVDQVSGSKQTGTSTSLGYKRVRNNLLQGYEYHIISNKKLYKAENYKLTFGYKPSFKFKYSPYLEYQFGVSNFEDLTNGTSGFGYINSLELGFFIKRLLPIHIMGGTRYSIINYDNDIVSDLKSQEIFLRFGFEF